MHATHLCSIPPRTPIIFLAQTAALRWLLENRFVASAEPVTMRDGTTTNLASWMAMPQKMTLTTKHFLSVSSPDKRHTNHRRWPG
ncbi:MAG TPA: hypothetical protein DCY79_17220 [Planctomycetaceae bacterium]|nr:hypothetical protein [Blastopirellula sp.]HAY81546.1 hypothetical protein [Planctomycetaceae bacterium]